MRDLILMLSFIDSLDVVSPDETDRITKVLSKGTNIPAKTSLFEQENCPDSAYLRYSFVPI